MLDLGQQSGQINRNYKLQDVRENHHQRQAREAIELAAISMQDQHTQDMILCVNSSFHAPPSMSPKDRKKLVPVESVGFDGPLHKLLSSERNL